ncbi:tRNA pseudouridine(55) synthase TruB [Sporichthya sp.]|uniref:tRNA pseudouridine(55) synthase TruB n=1 Tax=Sporichthya sp. TaxID=65475 RepID=UPI0017A7C9E2|nr:tRNA pseudouridine(55) synthase TruB [Sporichthya sp.]MBA3744766.1 tRNA pseudouridine(55) synthase TruB [Sporichthya sp.]
MSGAGPKPGLGGLVIVDKFAGMTSHDVVGRIRKLANTRKVGHAGTLDPMATGVLVVGIERATRLLGHLAGGDKSYAATIRLGAATDTDDAMGMVTASADASAVGDEAIAAGIAVLSGDIEQVPSTISAIKVDGKRAYSRARAGEEVELAARAVQVERFAVLATRRAGEYVDLDVEVDCSTGTYIRALARDLGAGLGVGGHLTALRRTRVGPFGLDGAHTLDELAETWTTVPIAQAARATFAHRDVDAEAARILVNGGWLPAELAGVEGATGPTAVFGPDEWFCGLIEVRDGRARPIAVFGDA